MIGGHWMVKGGLGFSLEAIREIQQQQNQEWKISDKNQF